MEVILNIGLNGVPGNSADEQKLNASIAAHREGFEILAQTLVESDTEPTLVIRAYRTSPWHSTFDLAGALNQDCIAAYYPSTRTGLLIGPRAEQWGEFNPEFFIQLDGTRLGQFALPKAA